MKKTIIIILYLAFNVICANCLIEYKGMEENTPYIIPLLVVILVNSVVIGCTGLIYALYKEIKK